jgi:hypothetical protein
MDTIDLLRQPPERDTTLDREFVGEAVGGE